MPAQRFLMAAAVYAVLVDGDRILLMRRAGSGYHDGELSVPAGHLDGDEDAVSGLARELREELEIEIDDCRLGVLMHRRAETPADNEYFDLLFVVERWRGTPVIGEPDKCSELVWVDRDDLPADIVPYVREALQTLRAGKPLMLWGWPGKSTV